MGAVIDILQWLVIISLMVMLFFTTRKLDRVESRPAIYQTLPFPPLEELKAVCGCDHHQCFHDENGCGSSWCGCKRYMGPEHLPSVIP